MAFNTEARQRLQRFVRDARSLIEKDFLGQMQGVFAMDPTTGRIADLGGLQHLSITAYETASDLREIFHHYRAQDSKASDKSLLTRILREQTQTFLLRLCALRMAEERGVFMESLAEGSASAAFKNYCLTVGDALGSEYDIYTKYLKSLFDELAGDLPQIFNRTEPFGLLFLEERSFYEFLNLINAGDLAAFWQEDETIGWIFQYFNSAEEFLTMRGQQNKNPKDSYELAVRNQFFTPRYVVEFLLDNTLGRVWVEETHGQTKLLKTCKYLINCEPAARVKTRLRDPRTLKVLDPACGSMHFGLYAFDLLCVIYEEAWDWLHGEKGRSFDNPSNQMVSEFDELYKSKDAFLAAVPSLIIQHNIYGVDIDVRATQIASLALWLRAQKAFQQQNIPSTERKEVGEGHVVAALAPPAEKNVLGRLQQEVGTCINLEIMFDNLRQVPETGLLLPLERNLERVANFYEMQQRACAESSLQAMREVDLFGEWDQQREALAKVLDVYVHQTGHSFQERLYARNAEECLKLIDLCQQQYDVIVMNPPFGAPASDSKEVLGALYPSTKREILGMFILRAQQLLTTGGYVGAITSRSVFFQGSSEHWREEVVYSGARMPVFVDLGPGVMDNALVESAAYVFGRIVSKENDFLNLPSVFIDVTDTENKEERLQTIYGKLGERRIVDVSDVYEKPLCEFLELPGKILAYKAPKLLIESYKQLRRLEEAYEAKTGIQTGDNFRYVRLHHEIEQAKKRWVPLCKGGEAMPFYGDAITYINWNAFGEELKRESDARVQNRDYYFRPALTWTLRANALSLRVFPNDGIFDRGGSCVFCSGDSELELMALSAVLNSRAYQNIMSIQLQMASGNSRYECGMLSVAPVPNLTGEDKERLAKLAKENYSARRRLDSVNETSHAFLLPMTIQLALEHLDPQKELAIIEESQRNMDEEVDKLYGFTSRIIPKQEKSRKEELPNEEDNLNALLSWAVGVAFGRFDRRLATMEREFPEAPAPFDPYPMLSPGRLPTGDMPFIQNRGIFVMDSSHPMDLETAIHRVLDEFNLCGEIDIDKWLRNSFFPWHLKQYSAMQRTAPIYWPIGTSSGSYVLWLYYPALNDQTLYTVLNDFVDPKIKAVAKRFDEMKKDELNLDAKGRRTLENLEKLSAELSVFRSQIDTLAQTFTVHFDDGVAINASRFRHLIQDKTWVKKQLNDVADTLECGKDKNGKTLDWSETAADLHPERVRELCLQNPSIALAHKNRWPVEQGK